MEENNSVNVHNDALMVSLGIRCPKLEERDPSVWTKTPSEKKTLRRCRHHFNTCHFNSIPEKHIPVRDKLIIYLKSNKKYPKSTYSIECWQHEIPRIISNFFTTKRKGKEEITEPLVIKYYWNGQTYSPTEIPFWGF